MIGPIKIAHIATVYGSVVTILYSKLRALNRYDDIDVVAISSQQTDGDSRNSPVRHIAVKMARSIKPLSDLKSIWRLYKVLKREKFDIIHSHTSKAGFISAVAAKMAKVPVVLHTHHGLPFFEGQNRILYHTYYFLEKTACMLRNHIFTQNRRDTPQCIRLIGSESGVSLEGNGVNVKFINQCAERQLECARRDYPGQGIRLLLLTRLEPVKRVTDFFKTVNKLIQNGIEVSCVVAGRGKLEQTLAKQLVKMGLEESIKLVGFSNRPQGLVQASDIVCLCSEKEGIPRSLMEAMALQKPVVATNVTGTQELVVDGKTGFLVPLGDTNAMADKIRSLAKNEDMRAKMGSAGLQRVYEHFDDVKIAEFLREFYLKAVFKNRSC
jgi:glycosyltransferase involved in cell wall biosynthesis